MRRRLLSLVLLAPLLATQTGSAFAGPNLVANAGFDTGNFNGWTVGGNTAYTGVTASKGTPGSNPSAGGAVFDSQAGTYHAEVGTADPVTISSTDKGSDIWQSIATIAGQTYNFSFWLNAKFSPGDSSASASWDGGLVFGPAINYSSNGTWTQYSYNVTASSSSTVILFDISNPNSETGLDSVSVTSLAPSSVPEPSSLLLIALAVPVIGVGNRIRRRALGS